MRKLLLVLLIGLTGPAHAEEEDSEYETVVTSSRGEEEAFRSPRSIKVVGRKELRVRQPETTPESLQDAPGFYMQRTNLAGGAPIIRGLLGPQVLLLVDGVRLNNAITRLGPNQLLNTVDPYQIQRVEVLRGPGSMLYGSDAMGGVINIITRKPAFDPRRAWDLGGEVAGRFNSAALGGAGHANVTGHLRSVGVRVGGTFKHMGDLTGGADTGLQPFTGYTEGAADVSAAWWITPEAQLRLGYGMVRQGNAHRTDRSTPTDFRRFTDQDRDLLTLAYSHDLEDSPVDRVDATVSFHSQRELRERFRLNKDRVEREWDDVSTLGAGLSLASELPWNNTLTYGFDLYHDWVASRGEREKLTAPSSPDPRRGRYMDDSRYLQFGAYAQDRLLLLNDKLALDAGLRVSVWNVGIPEDQAQQVPEVEATHPGVVGSLHARYLVGDGLNIVAGVSQGFRAPNVDDYSATGCSGQGFDRPNPDLDAEKSVTAEAGIKLDLFGLLRGSIFYYFTYLDGLIVRRPVLDAGGRPLQQQCGTTTAGAPVWADETRRENADSGMIHGVEMDLALDLGRRWTIFTWVAWTHGAVSTADNDDEPMSRVPPVNGLAAVRLNLPEVKGFTQLGVRWAARQDRISTRDSKDSRICPSGPAGCDGTAAYGVLSLRSAAEVAPGVLLGLTLENLTNATYRVHGSGVDGPGLSLVANLEVRFP